MERGGFWLTQLRQRDAEAGSGSGLEALKRVFAELGCPRILLFRDVGRNKATGCACDQDATRRRKRQ